MSRIASIVTLLFLATAGCAPLVVQDETTRLSRVTDAYPSISPDGSRIVFMSNATGEFDLYVSSVEGSERRRLTSAEGRDGTPVWSPDGGHIAFQSLRDGNAEIYVMAADGTGVRRLTTNEAVDMHPSWSPDGRKILFNSNRDDETGFALYTLEIETGRIERLTPPGERSTYASYSPDGEKIVFVRWTGESGDNGEIFVAGAQGQGATRLTQHASFDGWPSWSPDGALVVFSSNRTGAFRLYTIRPDGTGLTRLDAATGDAMTQPSWAPDGRAIVFASYSYFRDGGPEEAAEIRWLQLDRP